MTTQSDTTQSDATQPKQGEANNLLEWTKSIIIALVIVFICRWFIFTPTIVSGISMEPNFHNNERIIVNKFIYYFSEPKRGEVIVFHALENSDYIKRVIAVAGDTVMVDGDDVFVNGELINETYIEEPIEEARSKGSLYNTSADFKVDFNGISAVKVPEGTVFVLGDNRPRSKDSRSQDVGFVDIKEIKGRADLMFWPINEMKLIKHPKDVMDK